MFKNYNFIYIDIYFLVCHRSKSGNTIQFSSVAQSCPTLCDPMNHSTPGLPGKRPPGTPWSSITNSRSSLKLMSIELVMPFSHLILWHPLLLLPSILPSISLFQWVNSSWGGQSIGVSALASVLPVNTQDWSPLGWTG